METSCRTLPSVHHCTVAPPTPSEGAGALSTGKSRGGKQLEVCSKRPDSCKTGGKCLPQRGDDTNASVRLHVIRHTSSGDVCVHVCYENVFALQLHVESVQVRSDVHQQC